MAFLPTWTASSSWPWSRPESRRQVADDWLQPQWPAESPGPNKPVFPTLLLFHHPDTEGQWSQRRKDARYHQIPQPILGLSNTWRRRPFRRGGTSAAPKGREIARAGHGKAIARLCARSPLLLVPALAARKVYAQNISVLFSALIGQIPRIALSIGLGSGPKDFHRQGMVQLTIVLSANCTPSIKKEKVAPWGVMAANQCNSSDTHSQWLLPCVPNARVLIECTHNQAPDHGFVKASHDHQCLRAR